MSTQIHDNRMKLFIQLVGKLLTNHPKDLCNDDFRAIDCYAASMIRGLYLDGAPEDYTKSMIDKIDFYRSRLDGYRQLLQLI